MISYLLILSFFLSLFAVRFTLAYARKRLLDQVNERSSHTVPTPRGGGLGLVLAAILSWLLISLLVFSSLKMSSWLILLASFTLAALGWWDDHQSLSAKFRLLIQLFCSALVVYAFPLPDEIQVLGFALSGKNAIFIVPMVLAVIWLINLTNFMDGIDGIAGIQGLIGTGGVGILLFLTIGQWEGETLFLLISVSAACAGFLVWNWSPAKIFMGDVGSTVLGLWFAVGVLAGLTEGVALEILLLPIAPFIADASFTLLKRALKGEKLSTPHRSHLYQHLAIAWQSHAKVSCLYAGFALLGFLLAWIEWKHYWASGCGLLIWTGLFVIVMWYFKATKVVED